MKGVVILCGLLACATIGGIDATNLSYAQICPEMGVYSKANTKSCTKYYICFNGQALQRECPRGLEYDVISAACLPASRAKCQLDFCANTKLHGVTMVPNPDDCNRYFACSGGVTTRMLCPRGLLFNSKIGSCDLADNVECVLDNDDFITIESRIACPPKGVSKQANPDDCSQYSICINGLRADYKCGNELLFDTRSMTCNLKSKAKCFK